MSAGVKNVYKVELNKNNSQSKSMAHVSKNGTVEKKQVGDGKSKKRSDEKGLGDDLTSLHPGIQMSLANDSDKSANKSWYELVEEDENEEKKPLGKKDKGIVAIKGDEKEVETKAFEKEDEGIVAGVKIKKEKIELDDKKVLLIASVKVEKDIKIKKKEEAIESSLPKTEHEIPTVKVKPESVSMKREREVKSSLSTESDSDMKEKRMKHQKHARRSQRIAAVEPAYSAPTSDDEANNVSDSEAGESTASAEELKLARLTSMRKRNRDTSKEGTRNKRERNHSTSTDNSTSSRKHKLETDPATLARRQKQIDFGKNTVGYDRYRAQIPKEMRTILHPRTPPKHKSYSRRAWDGMVKIWRQQLHIWDPEGVDGEADSMSEISTTNSSCNLSDEYTSTAGSYDDGGEDCLDLGHE